MAVVYIQLLYQVYILALIVAGTEIETVCKVTNKFDKKMYFCVQKIA